MKIHDQLATFTSQLQLLSAFVKRFEDKIPEGLGYIAMGTLVEPSFNIALGFHSKENATRGLFKAGEIFGTEGWKGKVNYGRDAYDWSKMIEGVRVEISGAETMPKRPPEFDVPPNKFPIQLEDRKE